MTSNDLHKEIAAFVKSKSIADTAKMMIMLARENINLKRNYKISLALNIIMLILYWIQI